MGITKKHNYDIKKHKTPFNRGEKNHNLKLENYNFIFYSSFGLLFITILAGFIMSRSVPVAKADTSIISTAAVTVSSSCSVGAVVDSPHVASLVNGSYSGGQDFYPDGIGKTTITALCNNSAGFSIYAVGYSGNPGIYGNNVMIGTLNSNHRINTSTATSGDTSGWAMKITKINDATAYRPENLTITNGFDDFHTVPDVYTQVASFSSTTDDTLGSKLAATYAVYVSPSQGADTYVGRVKYTLVHPHDAPAPSILSEYGIAYMQDFTRLTPGELVTVKDAMIAGQKYILTDIRDGTEYYVGKLNDGNVWLLDNLALDLNDRDVVNALSSANTNATEVSLNYLRNGGGTANDKYPIEPLRYTNWTSGVSYSTPLAKSNYKDTVYSDDSLSDEAKTWKYGVYYNYCALSAGTYCYGNGSFSDSSGGNANEDICPKGWRLPTGRNDGEYGALYGNNYGYSSASPFRSALRLPLSGTVSSSQDSDGGTVSGQGTRSEIWASNWNSYDTMSDVFATSSNVSSSSYNRRGGLTARCILDTSHVQTIANVNYMQEVTNELVDDTPINFTTTLRDSRDGTRYTVGKLADGHLWLLDNLALDLTNQTVVSGLNSTNTNASDATLNYLKNGGGGGTGLEQYATSGLTYGAWVNGQRIAPMLYTALKDTGNGDDTLSNDARTWKYGIFYNYCAASAGSYCFSGNSSGNATEDICPKGWRMPTGGSSGEYAVLNNSNYGYGSYSLYRTALRLPLSGSMKDSPSGQGSSGIFWSSTRNDDSWMHYLHIDDSMYTFTASYYSTARTNGLSMRCIFGQ